MEVRIGSLAKECKRRWGWGRTRALTRCSRRLSQALPSTSLTTYTSMQRSAPPKRLLPPPPPPPSPPPSP
ncbi:hypothetical protein BCR35DRAFT_305206 [Leucosporidium creatinivorum]|uniref:Uncharacterized protein n=1 Tax=Leucosporidium creatinivorum TaxID=106004 RepID=A0A1Y2F526_9BASI|nr:hypothetical protein BCR35DRAFT_305206 [Leucosporidium creatinivorum]